MANASRSLPPNCPQEATMQQAAKLYLTMVLPAPHGCNLRCPFCAIAQRGEARTGELRDADYVRFLRDVAQHLPIERFSLQGYEPLLPETWGLTKLLLQEADQFDLETGLVTNGVTLKDRAEELSGLADGITVSLDSDASRRHDKLRGMVGAWEATVRGIRAAVEHFKDEDGVHVEVNSVLFPKKARYLEGMPRLLRKLGVTQWVISPLINFTDDRYTADVVALRQELLDLSRLAKREGIEVNLGDELRRHDTANLYELLSVAALVGEESVVRLSPDATLSRGREILRTSSAAPVWDRREEPHVFLKRVLAEVGCTLD